MLTISSKQAALSINFPVLKTVIIIIATLVMPAIGKNKISFVIYSKTISTILII